jgi:hypothetical protein
MPLHMQVSWTSRRKGIFGEAGTWPSSQKFTSCYRNLGFITVFTRDDRWLLFCTISLSILGVQSPVPQSLTYKNSTFCPHSVFMYFVWISEQTAIISLYSINWLVFITETVCVYCAVRSAHTVYLCVLCGSQNKQRLFDCTELTDWFLQPRWSVFTARHVLPTQCIYVFCVDLRSNSDYFTVQH